MSAAETIQRWIERIERVEEEKAAAQRALSERYREAKAVGLDVAMLKRMVKLRRMSAAERAEADAREQVYRAALGMLDGTPLGAAAMKKLAPPPPESAGNAPGPEQPPGTGEEASGDGAAAAAATITPEMVAAARDEGRQAAAAGKQVFDNPYRAGDPRRAAWDEGWCQGSGSDGMDIPAAYRRPAKPGKDADAKGSKKGGKK